MPQSEQTGHTWHKFALSGTFSETSLGFIHGEQKTAPEAEFVGLLTPFFCCNNMKDTHGNQ